MILDFYVNKYFAGLWKYEDDQYPVCVKSRNGYVMTLGGFLLHWVSTLQTNTALSTLEAEYITLFQDMRDVLTLKQLIQEVRTQLKIEFSSPTIIHSTLFEENNGALGLATSPRTTPRTRHIDLKYNFFRENVGEVKEIMVQRVD